MSEEDMNALRIRAYRIWEEQGRPEGEHESHWHQALAELGLVSPVEQPIDPVLPAARKRRRSGTS